VTAPSDCWCGHSVPTATATATVPPSVACAPPSGDSHCCSELQSWAHPQQPPWWHSVQVTRSAAPAMPWCPVRITVWGNWSDDVALHPTVSRHTGCPRCMVMLSSCDCSRSGDSASQDWASTTEHRSSHAYPSTRRRPEMIHAVSARCARRTATNRHPSRVCSSPLSNS
jgi:hypothetical protein